MNRSKPFRSLFFGLAILLGSSSLQAAEIAEDGQGLLHIEIYGIESREGVLYVALWADPEGWLKAEPMLGHEIPADAETKKVVIRDLEPGTYAISVIHDLNHNETFDSNFLGIPVEPFGFSNNIRNRFGPVSFEAASFEVQKEPITHKIEVKPLGGGKKEKAPESEESAP